MNGILLVLIYALGGGLWLLGLPAIFETLYKYAERQEARSKYILRKDGTRIYRYNR